MDGGHSHQQGRGQAKGEVLEAAFSCTLGPKDIPKAMALDSHTDQRPRSSEPPGSEEARELTFNPILPGGCLPGQVCEGRGQLPL